jgi:hypothetical protein
LAFLGSSKAKWPGCEADHCPVVSSKEKNGGDIPSLLHTSSCSGGYFINDRDKFIFLLLCRIFYKIPFQGVQFLLYL